ncbi:MAG: molybdate ABC transporter substrate-binding protein [Nitrospiraceae bacterium]|nr:molybdate ABC transporter substrate-binding protein [Nitrospiraceae bacterium]
MSKRGFFLRATLIAMLAIALWPPGAGYADHPRTLTIAAANSLKEALRAILPIFEKEQGNVAVRVIWGPSQSLRDQIAQGAPIDVFLPSSLEEIDQLETKGLTLQGTKQVYAETALVLITQAAVPARVSSLRDLSGSDVRRIAVGDPKTSSVGKFAAQVLKNSRLDSDLKPRYVYAEHSGAVLNLVATGEAEVGLVYRTDAVKNKNVHIVAEVPAETHSPIVYGLATVWTSKNPPLARHFGEFMLSSQIQNILRSYGFERAASDVNTVQR